jgi:hypothetical protein
MSDAAHESSNSLEADMKTLHILSLSELLFQAMLLPSAVLVYHCHDSWGEQLYMARSSAMSKSIGFKSLEELIEVEPRVRGAPN